MTEVAEFIRAGRRPYEVGLDPRGGWGTVGRDLRGAHHRVDSCPSSHTIRTLVSAVQLDERGGWG